MTDRELLKHAQPCPFCGKSNALKIMTAQELAEEGDDDPEPWVHSEAWAVLCDGSKPNGPGGCGASAGFFPTVEQALQHWNVRTTLQDAIALAYGHLWCLTEDPGTPSPLRSPMDAAYAARKILRALLTTEQRGNGIDAARKAAP